MKKLRFFGILSTNLFSANLLMVVALLSTNMLLAGLVLTACSDSSDGGNEELRTSTYYGECYEGIVEVTFSSKSLEAIALGTVPRDGDYYIIKLNGDLVSSGQVMLPSSGKDLTFVPASADSSPFGGTLGSNGALTVPAIPLTGGGIISLPQANPSANTVTTAQGAAIEGFHPDYEKITASGFKIGSSTAAAVSTNPDTGQIAEYAVSKNNAAPVTGWQRGLEFTGLDASTVYYVWARSGAKITTSTNYFPGTAIRGEETVKTAASARGLLDKINDLFDGSSVLGDDSTVLLTGKVELDKALEIEPGVTLIVYGTLKVKGNGRLNIAGTVDIGAGTWAGSGASVTLSESGTIILPSGANAEALNAVITEIKNIDRGEGPDYSGNAVVRLTPAFYDTGLTSYIVVDPDDVDNKFPYTIRGMGKDTTNDMNNSDIPKLGVGMWLANNNVTLEDVSFKITTITRGLVPARPWTEDDQGEIDGSYGVALLLGRTETGGGEMEDFLGGSKNVTVQNCAIAIKGGLAGDAFTGGIWVHGSPSDIKILGNTVNVTGKEGNAAQALAFEEWGNYIQVKNNKLTAKFANPPDFLSLEDDDFYARPVSAFYIGGLFEKPSASAYKYTAGDISGNTLSYDPVKASVFSYYVCAFPNPLPLSPEAGSRKGVTAMGSKKFGTSSTKWALDSAVAGDCHRLVVGDLINDCKSNGDGAAKNGFGAVLMYVSYEYPDNTDDYNVETYKIADEKLTNIGVRAWKLTSNLYGHDENEILDINVTVNTNGSTTPGTAGHLRYWK